MIRRLQMMMFVLAVASAGCSTGSDSALNNEPDLAVSSDSAEVESEAEDITAQRTGACTEGANGDEEYCTPECPCEIGEGDCDYNADCVAGLRCTRDVGATYGFPATLDMCTCPDDSLNGTASFCSTLCQCSDGQGDCDSNEECATGLTCYRDGGAAYGMDPTHDVCATCLPAAANGTIDFCNAGCLCSEGQGDCDTDADCAAGLKCYFDAGADFGLPADTDVCAACPPPSKNGQGTYCSAECPCEHGEGDCDSGAECAPGLNCVADVGAQYGQEPLNDVCVDPNL